MPTPNAALLAAAQRAVEDARRHLEDARAHVRASEEHIAVSRKLLARLERTMRWVERSEQRSAAVGNARWRLLGANRAVHGPALVGDAAEVLGAASMPAEMQRPLR
jgi:hypothetical protein